MDQNIHQDVTARIILAPVPVEGQGEMGKWPIERFVIEKRPKRSQDRFRTGDISVNALVANDAVVIVQVPGSVERIGINKKKQKSEQHEGA